MKIFLDTANIEEIKRFNDLGIIDGVTTNPTLIAKEGGDPKATVREICNIVCGPVSTEVLSTNWRGMIEEAQDMAKWAPNTVIKIPSIPDGLRATKVLSQEGLKVNMTLVFSASQALLASKVGATYVSPFIGRMDDISNEGMEVVSQILTILEHYPEFETQVIVSSVRHPVHVIQAAMMGAHVATIPPKVLDQMQGHPLTDKGVAQFLEDAKKFSK